MAMGGLKGLVHLAPLVLLCVAGITVLLPQKAVAQACVFDWTVHYEPLTRLFNDFDATAGDGDSMTVPVWLSISGNDLRESWYAPAEELPGTAPLYRFFNSNAVDHMDRPDPSMVPGTYMMDPTTPLCYPWESGDSRLALSPIRTWIGTPFDHRTWLLDETPTEPGITYTADSTFTDDPGPGRYGYQRFGSPLPFNQTETFSTYERRLDK